MVRTREKISDVKWLVNRRDLIMLKNELNSCVYTSMLQSSPRREPSTTDFRVHVSQMIDEYAKIYRDVLTLTQ